LFTNLKVEFSNTGCKPSIYRTAVEHNSSTTAKFRWRQKEFVLCTTIGGVPKFYYS